MPARHALWLIPAEPVRARCAAWIDALARELGTPSFAPHVTLLQGIPREAGEVVDVACELARALRPLAVTLGALREAPDYYRALFVEVAGPELHAAHRRAAAALGTAAADPFAPHLSLVYGELSSAIKEPIRDRIGRALEGTATVDRLEVVDTEGRPPAWITRASLPLEAQ